MKYDLELNKEINNNIDIKYAQFHGKLVPNTKIKGVRIPVLRKIAKDFLKYDDFLENISLDSYESVSVACYYIGLKTKDLATLKTRLDFILPYINNWAVCDTFVSSLKVLKKQGAEFLPTLYNYLNIDNDFVIRFTIVCFLCYYAQEDLLEDLFNKVIPLQDKNYYIDMAIAWFVSVAFVKCRAQTLKLLKSKRLSKTVQNLSISKICDSFRVSLSDKQLVRQLRF